MSSPYRYYRDFLPRNKISTSYRRSGDICSICGESGGAHYSEDGISWCYCNKDRERYRNDPKYQTSFSHSVTDKSNPNTTFKNKRMEE